MLRDHVVLLVVSALTSLLMTGVGRRWGLGRLGEALLSAVEVIGATTLFFAANLVIGGVLVLAVRRMTPFYLSLYEVTDVALLLVSLVQSLVFEGWRRAARPG